MTRKEINKHLQQGFTLLRADKEKLKVYFRTQKHPEERELIRFDDVDEMNKWLKDTLKQHKNYMDVDAHKKSKKVL